MGNDSPVGGSPPAVRGRVGIVGGSIAGCAAAIALARAGYAVTVFERSRGGLRGRGAGIAVPQQLHRRLIDTGYLSETLPAIPATERHWVVRDPSAALRVAWRQPSPGTAVDWAWLWRSLRDQVPQGAYHETAVCAAVSADAHAAHLVMEDGTRHRFDAVLGADGYNSAIRRTLHPETVPVQAGYVAWRGACTTADVNQAVLKDLLDGGWATAGFSDGHAVFYRIPGEQGSTGWAESRINWVLYSTDSHALPAPPGSVPDRAWTELRAAMSRQLPTELSAVLAATPHRTVAVQELHDIAVPAYAQGRLGLVGDAAALSRPHASSGVLKALQDALELERSFRDAATVTDALTAYSTARTVPGNHAVELGARFGRHQVEHPPTWSAMSTAEFDRWTKNILAGDHHYLYGNMTDGTSEARRSAAPTPVSERTNT